MKTSSANTRWFQWLEAEIAGLYHEMPKVMTTRVMCVLAMLSVCSVNVFSQSKDADDDLDERTRAEVASLNLPTEVESRMGHALAAFEKMLQAGRYISSISELIRNKEMQMPVGLKSPTYTICIEELYEDSIADGQKSYIKAICVIPTPNGEKIAFDGIARIDGDNGVGTHGKLELIAPIKKKIGKDSCIKFQEGTSLSFGCDGFQEVDANISFILDSDKIYAVNSTGNNTGKLTFETRAHFSDLNDFTVEINSDQSFCFKGLDGFVFTLNNVIFDHSHYNTPVTANFPTNYFAGGDVDESRKYWQGLAASRASVTLPEYMSADDGGGKKSRATLQLENVLIDGNGFTGTAEAKDVISDSSIDPESWSMSVNDFKLAIDRNVISGVGFAGKVNVPPLGKSSMLAYKANYNVEQQTFILQSSLGSKLDFPMLCAKLTFDENSTISLKVGDGGIYPTINASGLLSVEAPIGKDTTSNKLTLPDLRFEGMVISRDKFELGTASLTGKLETPSMAGFKLTLSDINTIKNGDGQGLSIRAAVAVNDMFNGDAGIALYGDNKTWKFSKVKMDKIHVKYESSAFSIDGGVEFRDGDEIYGKGFRGDLKFELIKKFKIDAVGVFGHKDGYRYFLTDVFYETQPASGILVPPALSFYGFGGGLYNHMQQNFSNSRSDFGKSLTGINYVPDKKVGMGFMARTKFGLVGSSSLFDADVNLEIQFNDNWGVNFVQLRGEATMLSVAQQESMLGGLKKSLEKVEKKSGNIVEFDKSSLDTKPEKDGALTASVGMKFDIEHDVFTADMKAYLDVADVLKGRGANNCMGWANAYFAKNKWYTYIGTPKDRLGVSLLGIADAGGYFMVGSDVPELPDMPEKVKSKLSANYVSSLTNRSDEDHLSGGKGLAFGADLSVNLEAKLKPFYAKLGVGMGTEMLLKQYPSDAHCEGRSGPIGIDGWYAQAQAWAWVDAAIGMRVTLFKKDRKFDIISGEMAAFLRGAGPNPIYFTGAVGGNFSILGGLVHGKCSFDFTIGKECKVVTDNGSPFDEDVIAQLTPADKSSDVNVFIAPQLVLNIPANEKMTIEDERGRKETYRVGISEFSISDADGHAKRDYTVTYSEDKRVWTYDMDEPLESHKQYKAHAKVTFERLNGDKWVEVTGDDGKPYVEEKTVEFTSGERPKYIMPEHVKYAYPADRQYNFLSKEYNQAYVMVSENYSYLFTTEKPKGFDQKVQFTTFDGKTVETSFTHKSVSDVAGVKFEVDIPIGNISLATNQIYNMAIVNVPQRTATVNENISDKQTKLESTSESDITKTEHEAEGNLEMLEQTEIYAVDFRTSSYKTFVEKMGKMSVGNVILSQDRIPTFVVSSNVYDKSDIVEVFDKFEYDKNNVNDSYIHISPNYINMPYYTEHIKPLIYGNNDVISVVGVYSVPTDVVTLYLRTSSNILEDNDIELGTHNGHISFAGALHNYMQRYIDRDYMEISTKLANTLIATRNKTNGIEAFMKTDAIPDLIRGLYPLSTKYVLPGKNIKTSEYIIKTYY